MRHPVTLYKLSVIACLVISVVYPREVKPEAPASQAEGAGDKIVCFFPNWGQYIRGQGRYTVNEIDPFLCTHIIHAFALIEGTHVVPSEYNDPQTYVELNELKAINADLKTMVSIGGYSMGSGPYERLCDSLSNMRHFAINVVQYLRSYGFDGVDIDWEYPPSAYRDRFTLLLRILRYEFENEAQVTGTSRLLLSSSLSASVYTISSSYNLADIHQPLDFGNIMTYDYHGYWGSVIAMSSTGFNSPLYGKNTHDQLCQDWTLNAYVDAGFPRDKFVLGIAAFGRTFTLCEGTENNVGDMACGPGLHGYYSRQAGVLSYNEICQRLKHPRYTSQYDTVQEVPYAYMEKQWMGFDNVVSVTKKIEYAQMQSLAGVMYWDLSKDDFRGWCQEGAYPLTRLASRLLNPGSSTTGLSSTSSTTTAATTTTQRPPTPATTTTSTTTTTTMTTTPVPPTAKSSTTTKPVPPTNPPTSPPSAAPSTNPTPSTAPSTSPIPPGMPESSTLQRTTPEVPDIECSFDNQLHPHPEICDVYYRCNHGEPVPFMCPDGLCFDPYVNTCNWPTAIGRYRPELADRGRMVGSKMAYDRRVRHV